MTLDDAVRVLNRREYGGSAGWHRDKADPDNVTFTGRYSIRHLPAFEAIVIAQELERDAGLDMPATRELVNAIKASVRFHDKAGPEHMDGIRIGGRYVHPDTLRVIVAEWPDQPNPSTESDA